MLALFILILMLVLFWIRGIIFLDPDFGWHFQQGTYILTHGIPPADLYSYTMPSYPLIIHSWLSEVILAATFPILGFIGLGLASSLTTAYSLLIHAYKQKSQFIIIPLLLASSILLSSVAVRPQIITWLFFSILIFILFLKKTRWQYIIPLIFVAWVNLHGGFAIGILILAIDAIMKCFVNKKKAVIKLRLLLLSLLATCINPYGIYIWKEVALTFFNNPLRTSIAEWQPGILTVNLSLYFYLILVLMLILRYWKSFSHLQMIVFIVTFILGLSSNKHVPLLIIAAFPLLIQAFSLISKDAARHKEGLRRYKIAYKILLLIAVLLVVGQTFLALKDTLNFAEDSFYPQKAVAYLKNHPPDGQIFSDYNWGGYLVWKYPQKRVFIDGRMAIWRWRAKLENETDNALKDYLALLKRELSFIDQAEKYHITTLLLPSLKEQRESNLTKIWFLNSILKRFDEEKNYPDIITQVKQQGWKEIYKDATSIIYQKP